MSGDRRRTWMRSLWLAVAFAGCTDPGVVAQQASLTGDARGLALDIEDGAGVPLSVRTGQLFYVNQIDLRANIEASVDEGVGGLRSRGAAASLPWAGARLADEEPLSIPNNDGTFTRRRFYRDA